MVTKTPQELAAMSPDEIQIHAAEEEKIVFGHDVRHKNGQPLEQGIGSPGRETINHFTAIRKYEGEEAYTAAVAALCKRNPEHAKKLGLLRAA